jgi:flagellar basal body-associated protein FliL
MRKFTVVVLIGLFIALAVFILLIRMRSKSLDSIQSKIIKTEVNLPISSEKEAIEAALKTPEVRDIINILSNTNKG